LVHDTLIASMVHGAPYVAVAIAEHIEPFIDESTYPRYETALAGLAPGTKAHAALLAALEQYRLHRSGA
jgi:hypothetical protein